MDYSPWGRTESNTAEHEQESPLCMVLQSVPINTKAGHFKHHFLDYNVVVALKAGQGVLRGVLRVKSWLG